MPFRRSVVTSARNRLPVPGVTAPVEVARRFADLWTQRHGLTAKRSFAQRIYRLEHVIQPSGVSGATRIATQDDRELLIDWTQAFLVEAVGGSPEERAETIVDSALETGSRTFYLWEDGGSPVSMAGVTGPTPNGIRVGPSTRRRDRGDAATRAR